MLGTAPDPWQVSYLLDLCTRLLTVSPQIFSVVIEFQLNAWNQQLHICLQLSVEM